MEVYEAREGPSTKEKQLLTKCHSSLDAAFEGNGKIVLYLEDILCNLSYDLDAEYLIKSNKMHLDKLVDIEKFRVEHSIDHDLLFSNLTKCSQPERDNPGLIHRQPSLEDNGLDDYLEEPDAS